MANPNDRDHGLESWFYSEKLSDKFGEAAASAPMGPPATRRRPLRPAHSRTNCRVGLFWRWHVERPARQWLSNVVDRSLAARWLRLWFFFLPPIEWCAHPFSDQWETGGKTGNKNGKKNDCDGHWKRFIPGLRNEPSFLNRMPSVFAEQIWKARAHSSYLDIVTIVFFSAVHEHGLFCMKKKHLKNDRDLKM